MRAAFQNSPLNPVRSFKRLGNFPLMYVHVHIVKRTTVKKALKSNRADISFNQSVALPAKMSLHSNRIMQDRMMKNATLDIHGFGNNAALRCWNWYPGHLTRRSRSTTRKHTLLSNFQRYRIAKLWDTAQALSYLKSTNNISS